MATPSSSTEGNEYEVDARSRRLGANEWRVLIQPLDTKHMAVFRKISGCLNLNRSRLVIWR